MFKRLALMTMAATILAATPAYAGQWMQDGNGWWWRNDDGSYPTAQWQWIDGDADGISERYYFNENGELVISFDEYEVAPGYMGAVTFTIPLNVTGKLAE